MMPDMRAGVRISGGRRVSAQILLPEIVDNKVQQNPQRVIRGSFLLTPMSPRKIAIKPEGQREWKWLEASATAGDNTLLPLGTFVLPDNDDSIRYEVMAQNDWRQARVATYEFVERPR